jgi:hypothetical protein
MTFDEVKAARSGGGAMGPLARLLDARTVLAGVALGWAIALAYAALAGRSLYGDGGWFVLVHLVTPFHFNDYDFQRSFASFVSQAPILLGQRLGLGGAADYAALYTVGAFAIPAAALWSALAVARRQPALFAAIAFAIAIYGFGTSFINTEANLLFGLVWLAVAILALEAPAPFLRGFALPAIGFALLRAYEGMLLVGPVLALWAMLSSLRPHSEGERIGLVVAALFFVLGAVIGFGGFLSPRDPANASSFIGSAFAFLGNPQCLLLIAAALGTAAACATARAMRIGCGVATALFGCAYVIAIARLQGFYGFDVYFRNRAFMVLCLPLFVGAILAVHRLRPSWLSARPAPSAYALAAMPIAFAIAADMVGTYRWVQYLRAFCDVIEHQASPLERLQALKASGARTAWPWTHPTLSVLLRERASTAMVVNEPGAFGWEPFAPDKAPAIAYQGVCQSPLLAGRRSDSFVVPVSFQQARFPAYVERITGMSTPEAWGTWSDGARVELHFARELPRSFDLELRVATAFGDNKSLPVRVRAGEREQSFVADREPLDARLEFRDAGAARSIAIEIPRPESPAERGSGADVRKLGIGLVSLRIVPRE